MKEEELKAKGRAQEAEGIGAKRLTLKTNKKKRTLRRSVRSTSVANTHSVP